MASATAKKYVLKGRVVTMNATSEVLKRGLVYVEGNRIAAIQEEASAAPAGFEDAATLDTHGTIYPGLIELHNHLSYNALRLWKVPEKYTNRDQWPRHPEYRQLVTGPMGLLGKAGRPELLAALVRYVEGKCLVGGVTTSQGVKLASNAGVSTYYHGVVRNVEQPGDKKLRAAKTHIADVDAKQWDKFFKAISGTSTLILHLSEGTDAKARAHFLALQNEEGKWAITDKLVGIHCAALTAKDFGVFAEHGGSMVWSPLSNFLLYGETANVAAAHKEGVAIALGSDWAPSGSKNLLGELKVARIVVGERGLPFSDRDIVAMATCNPARMVQWGEQLGSLEAGKLADMLVVKASEGDPYHTLIHAHEGDIELVIIDGVPRYGLKSAMDKLQAKSSAIRAAQRDRAVAFHDDAANPTIENLDLGRAKSLLKDFLHTLSDPVPSLTIAPHELHALAASNTLRLVLDEQDPNLDEQSRPRLPYKGQPTGWNPVVSMAAVELPLIPLKLDGLTVADDSAFLESIAAQPNLPGWLKSGIARSY